MSRFVSEMPIPTPPVKLHCQTTLVLHGRNIMTTPLVLVVALLLYLLMATLSYGAMIQPIPLSFLMAPARLLHPRAFLKVPLLRPTKG